MGETFVFNVAEEVLEKLGSFALQEVCLAWGVESELDKLKSSLSTIKSVLLDAEQKQAKSHQLRDWLGKLKDALYDADDVLDEFHYEALRSQVPNRGGIKGEVRHLFSSSNPLGFRIKMGHKIKAIRQRFKEIADEKSDFHLTEQVFDRCVMHGEREMTHSFVRASDVIGRDVDKENIVKLLMLPGDGENVSVIPIVGIGGLGKTTLVKLVYNDERVVKHFTLRMWVCVSEDFDVTKLTKEIIKSAKTGENCNDLTIDLLQSCLRRTLDSKMFLLILDDVWNNDRGKWIELKIFFNGGAKGSKIVVTMRSQSIASFMGTIINPYNLKGLPHEECLSLFEKWAFKEGEEKLYPNLLKIGDEIVKKCGGVPLAIKTVGSLLYSRKNDECEYWKYVKDNEIWKLPQNETDILPALKLSYDAMPSYLKQCFSFCSIFPKDYEFHSIFLISMWISQGLIQSPNENQELEDIGMSYFKELWSRSFFQEVEEHFFFFNFKMHDLVHDLALLVSHSECSIVNCCTKNIYKSIRHVSSSDIDLFKEGVPKNLLKLENLRTVMIQSKAVGPTFVKTCIERFSYLRMLDLSNLNFEKLPTSIGNLKLLRYLDLSLNKIIKKLPNSICKLRNLQFLNLYGCEELEGLPKNIGNLISLRALWLTTKKEILSKEGIGRLKSLRLLMLLGCENLKSLAEGMQHLSALRTLMIVACDSLEESLPHIIRNLTALQNLSIFGCEKLILESDEDMQSVKLSVRSLVFHSISQLVTFPQWIQGAASTLQQLRIEDCHDLVALPEWLQNLTSLQRLQIFKCPELCALPEGMHRLTALRELKIEDCRDLSRRCQWESGENWLKIAHVPNITLDPIISDEEETNKESNSGS